MCSLNYLGATHLSFLRINSHSSICCSENYNKSSFVYLNPFLCNSQSWNVFVQVLKWFWLWNFWCSLLPLIVPCLFGGWEVKPENRNQNGIFKLVNIHHVKGRYSLPDSCLSLPNGFLYSLLRSFLKNSFLDWFLILTEFCHFFYPSNRIV